MVFACCLTLASCKSPPPSNQPPRWISEPKSDDSIYLYRVGHAAKQPSADAAREAAFQDAVNQIARLFSAAVPGGALLPPVSHLISGKAELVPGCVWIEKDGARAEGWVQISWPLAEKQRVMKRMALGEELARHWAEAQEALRKGQAEKARGLLEDVLQRQDQALFMSFELDTAKLMLGDINREQREVVEARACYESVINTSTSATARKAATEKVRLLPDPPRFWPIRDRWAGQKIALLCVIRDDKSCRRFLDLANVLTKDCGEARLGSVDIAQGLDEKSLAACFDKMDFSAACKAASAQQAGVVLAVLFDIDPLKRGATTQIYGVTLPAMDSMVRFFVVRVEDGKIIYNGQFKETAGALAESRLADRTTAIMITKYLVPNCPVVPAAVKEAQSGRPAD
ncbi:MAG: hypothetical protein Q8O57_04185 [Kiritimatiellota bacterium]|nr:hypothetical protein [Kiritimatiellota bacterium]